MSNNSTQSCLVANPTETSDLWVLSFQKRVHNFLQNSQVTETLALRIFLSLVRQGLSVAARGSRSEL